MSIILIGGGARSGKSRYALELARRCGGRLAFLATARAEDNEMRDRIAGHREERGAAFTTFEEPLAVGAVIAAEAGRFDTIVVDCLTLWLSNLMFVGRVPDLPRRGADGLLTEPQPSGRSSWLCGAPRPAADPRSAPARPERPPQAEGLPHNFQPRPGALPSSQAVGNIEAECCRLVECAAQVPARVLLVTNEVGCSIVPENALARRFRDAAGKLNQQAAEAANEVYWMIFGVPLKVK